MVSFVHLCQRLSQFYSLQYWNYLNHCLNCLMQAMAANLLTVPYQVIQFRHPMKLLQRLRPQFSLPLIQALLSIFRQDLHSQ